MILSVPNANEADVLVKRTFPPTIVQGVFKVLPENVNPLPAVILGCLPSNCCCMVKFVLISFKVSSSCFVIKLFTATLPFAEFIKAY